MSAEPVELRNPSATVRWPLGDVSADSVSVEASINRNTKVTFTAFSGSEAGEKANRVLSSDAAQLMGRAQQAGMARRNDPDCGVDLDDGADGKLSLDGFMVGPAYSLNRGSIQPSFSFVATAACLANLKLDIYTPVDRDGGEDVLAIQDAAKDSNIALRLKTLTQLAIQYWEKSKTNDPSGASVALAEQRHAINNSGPLKQWYDLLDNSVDSLQTPWFAGLSENPDFNSSFNNELLAILRGTSRDFLDVVESLMGSFQWILVPSIDGGAGKLIQVAEMVTQAPDEMTLASTAMVLRGTSGTDLLPVQQVMLRGVPEPSVLITDEDIADALAGGYLMGSFPETAPGASGDVIIESLPFYLDRIIRWSDGNTAVESANSRGAGGAPPDFNKFGQKFEQLVNRARKFQSKVLNDLVTDYCRNVYADRSIGSTTASIQIPATLEFWPGQRYRVKNLRGELLFTGFLAGVTHTFAKSGGTGNASTSLSFSHIIFPGFTLPGF
jgi:hypothetical protein